MLQPAERSSNKSCQIDLIFNASGGSTQTHFHNASHANEIYILDETLHDKHEKLKKVTCLNVNNIRQLDHDRA